MFTLSISSSLRTIEFDKHTILKYEKPCVRDVDVFRSVVKYDNRFVSVAPPRSIELDKFKQLYSFEDVFVDEFIEGTMVNLFYSDKWRICTKCNVGATNGFFDGAPCFADMFWEAATGIALNELDIRYVYSFVLQHPQNRIVCPVELNLYLIKVYEIRGVNVIEMPRPNIAKTPAIINFESYDALHFAASTLPYMSKGFMLHAPDGKRSKVFSEDYLKVSALRGSNASMKFRILELRNSPKLEYLMNYYPEYNALRATTTIAVRKFTNDLYSMYIDCFKMKSKPFNEFPREFKHHLQELHQSYTATWPVPIHKSRVVDYVSNLHASQLCIVL